MCNNTTAETTYDENGRPEPNRLICPCCGKPIITGTPRVIMAYAMHDDCAAEFCGEYEKWLDTFYGDELNT